MPRSPGDDGDLRAFVVARAVGRENADGQWPRVFPNVGAKQPHGEPGLRVTGVVQVVRDVGPLDTVKRGEWRVADKDVDVAREAVTWLVHGPARHCEVSGQ